jgi:hypothetical protein
LVQVIDETSEADTRALRRVTREVARSEVDTSRVVFDAGSLPRPADFAAAMEELTSRGNGSLGGLTPRAVLRAQYANPLAIETLCLAAGVAFSDAKEWFGSGSETWTLEQVTELWSYVDNLVEGRVESPIADSEAARAIELIDNPQGGWAILDRLRTEGVPYELLLAQRSAGGVWLQHKNRTSKFPNIAAADLLCASLRKKRIDFRRSSIVGGKAKQRDLQELSGIADKRIGVVAIGDDERATFAVAFSAARDGGTARANGDGLLQIPITSLPLAIVLTGLGWARRPETDRLARRYGGRIFTERSIDDLVDCIDQASSS